ncbi:hypothetical protein FJU08_21870 [Martelella alba]|uniref:Uncharacterized protein n=1 Tax=Martelella alba TaxID=2590451 RepID=A0A506TYS1_9HYPH|nr:hypothetical protein [Martelella alba]TPW26640.1 hypothetical protein FJU08_21870 [Martelella alba]
MNAGKSKAEAADHEGKAAPEGFRQTPERAWSGDFLDNVWVSIREDREDSLDADAGHIARAVK